MGQKIQFIVTVLHEPKLLIFDEPFSGFDPVNANIIRDEILELKDKGTTIIFSTHRMESVEEMCDYVTLINQSKKVLDGPINKIRESFKDGKYKVSLNIESQTGWSDLKNKIQLENLEETDKKVSFITKPELQNNSFISMLNNIGVVTEYVEIIPTMNDVFINAVKS